MLDINFIEENLDYVKKNLNSRGSNFSKDLDQLLKLNKKRKLFIKEVENLRSQKNKLSKEIGKLVVKKPLNKLLIEEIKNKVVKVNSNILELENNNENILEELTLILRQIPNLIDDSIPFGNNELDNLEIKRVGKIFKKDNLPHWEIAKKLDLCDFDLGTKLSGSRFLVYTKRGAKMIRVLADVLISYHNKNGYDEFGIPLIVNSEAMFGTGQLPKFGSDAYRVGEQFLIPTAEVGLTNFHSNEILNLKDLPLKYVSFSQCFRQEAGSAGKDTRGMIRLHQFNKVELVKIVQPENSMDELEKLLLDAEGILNLFNLPYRVVNLCSGDIGFSATKTYDLEVWFPNQKKYREISSCSNCGDFQARNIKTRYRDKDETIRLVHTLNGSGVAIDRLFASILENYWDGERLMLPAVLKPYFDNQDFLV